MIDEKLPTLRRRRAVWLNQNLQQLARFCAVGLTCFTLGLVVLASLHDLAHLNYLLAYVISFVVSNVVGYLLNARITFSVKTARSGAARYLAVNAALLLTNTTAMKLLVDAFHLWYIGAAILVACINTPVSFLTQRLVTYRLYDQTQSAGQ